MPSPLLFSLFLLVLTPDGAPSGSGTQLTGLEVAQEADRTRIELPTSLPVTGVVRRIDGTDLVVCELPGCLPVPGLGYRLIQGPQVRSIRVLPQQTSTLVEIALAASDLEFRYFTVKDAPRVVIEILPGRPARRAPKPEGQGAATDESATPPAAGQGEGESATVKADPAATSGSAAASPAPKPKTKTSVPSKKGKGSKADASREAKAKETERLVALGEKAIAAGEIGRGLSYFEVAAASIGDAGERRTLSLSAARIGTEHGLFAQASRFYARLLASPLDGALRAEIPLEYGRCLAATGDGPGALAAWDSALAATSDAGGRASVRRTRADWLLEQGRAADAEPDLRELAREGRDDGERTYAGYRLGVALIEAGKPDEAALALEAIPAAGGAFSDSATAYFARAALVRRADIAYKAGRFDEALGLYATILEREPGSGDAAWALFQSANAERRLGRYAEAIAHYETLSRDWPESRWSAMARWGADEAAWLLERGGKAAPAAAEAGKGSEG